MAVVVAQISTKGIVIQANQGFQRLAWGCATPTSAAPDVRCVFGNPSFEDLLAVVASSDHLVFQGILNLMDSRGVGRSLCGTVHRFGEQLMLVAEYDVDELEQLNAQVLKLNDELSELQRNLARANRQLQADQERLRHLSVTDPLTELANRRHLMDYLGQAWRRCQRYATICSVIMVDIDHFKKINDHYGHDQGDVVLKALAEQMKSMVRDVDLVARLGGEEFVIVLQEAPAEVAYALAERLRVAATQLVFAHIPAGISCSYGVAQMETTEGVDWLLKQADDALYHAKHSGRNRVSCAPPLRGIIPLRSD